MGKNEIDNHVDTVFARIMSVLKVGKAQKALDVLGVKRSTYDSWRKRGRIPEDRLYAFAAKLDVSKEWLQSGDILQKPTIKDEHERTQNTEVNNMVCDTSVVSDSGIVYGGREYVEIPYYKDVYASAGGGSDRTDGSVRSPVSFSRAFLNSYLGVYNLNGISIINAAGDSMEPTIRSGELMFVSTMENEEFKDGGIYVIMCGDVLMVKRVTYDPLTGEYTLVSDNGKVSPVKLRMDEAEGCRFVGRVVGHMDRV